MKIDDVNRSVEMKDDARWYIVGVPLAHIVLYFMGIDVMTDRH